MNKKGKITKFPTPKTNSKNNGNAKRDQIDAPSLARNFPHVLLALLKRIDRADRSRLLEEFRESHPTEFKKWYNTDVQNYLNGLGDQPVE